ncbi:MAG: precorrin-6A/cobalt-precorrin-6A reductase [Cyanobacteriota bacterium]|jgi:precorrin-6A/cobalt-precorrin-6A reductase|nr:precorrin-6A/cobalt-precorrin-6A reductase [Cyanobacteriota bacterium]
MHRQTRRGSPRAWLIAGTGDGLRLACALHQCGWRLLVSVVSQEAARRYPEDPGLELAVGAIENTAGVLAQLERARLDGDPFLAVVDASHPFASRITARLVQAWQELQPALCPPLFRLRRGELDDPPLARLRRLPDLEALASIPLHGRRLLLAVGSRHLSQAVSLSPGAVHHARLPPTPMALQQGGAAGLMADRLACLRPGDPAELGVLRALLLRWQIDTVLCRQSGGVTEALWRGLAGELELTLLLLVRPTEPAGLLLLEWEPLLEALQRLRDA